MWTAKRGFRHVAAAAGCLAACGAGGAAWHHQRSGRPMMQDKARTPIEKRLPREYDAGALERVWSGEGFALSSRALVVSAELLPFLTRLAWAYKTGLLTSNDDNAPKLHMARELRLE